MTVKYLKIIEMVNFMCYIFGHTHTHTHTQNTKKSFLPMLLIKNFSYQILALVSRKEFILLIDAVYHKNQDLPIQSVNKNTLSLTQMTVKL